MLRCGNRNLRDVAKIKDPSDDIQIVLFKWLDFYMLNRRQNLNERDIVLLHERVKDLLETLQRVLPEKTRTTLRDGQVIG